MRAAFIAMSLLMVLGGCGGIVADDGYTAGKYAMGTAGDCVDISTGAACLDFGSGSSGGDATTPPSTSTTPSPQPPDSGLLTPPPVPAAPPVPPESLLPPEEGGCWFTGGGTFGKGNTRDSFGGNAMTMKDKSVRGEWEHVDHTNITGVPTVNGQNLFHGKVHYIVCKKFETLSGPQVPKAYPNYINFGGTGKYNGVDGYFFDVRAFDHGEGGIHFDRYTIDVYDASKKLVLHADGSVTELAPSSKTCKDDVKVTQDLAWVLGMGCLSGGNLQIHPPNTGHPY
jgi:hypothetical protein